MIEIQSLKKADKGSYVVIWDRNDYVTESEKQLSDEVVYKQVNFKEKNLCDLVEIGSSVVLVIWSYFKERNEVFYL